MKATKNTGLDSKNILKSEEDEIVEYKCSKCRDLRFILKDNEAIPCTCKALREAEEILLNSGISEEFRKRISITLIMHTIWRYVKHLVKPRNM